MLTSRVIRAAWCGALVLTAVCWAQFQAFTDNFDGPTLHSRWEELENCSWTDTDGNFASGCMLLDATTAPAKASTNLYRGRGFNIGGPTMVSFYLKDPTGGASVWEIHLDVVTSCQRCGWWDYRGQVNFPSGIFETGWVLATKETVDDWGSVPTAWNGTIREAVVNGLANDTNCLGADTTQCDAVLRWRINVSSGQLLVDDWVQEFVTSVRPDIRSRSNDGWKLVTLSSQPSFPKPTKYSATVIDMDGQVVTRFEGIGNAVPSPVGLKPGTYVMKINSDFGQKVTTVVLPQK